MENKRNTYSSITFFYPSKIVGGAEFLFIRLAKFFSKTQKVYYIDYLDGFARNEIDILYENITFIEFFNDSKLLLPDNTILITPLSSIADVIAFIDEKSKARVLFWSIHPHGLKNIIELFKQNLIFNFFLDKKEAFGRALDFLIQKKSLFFMDGSNLSVQRNYFGFLEQNITFLPIPCEDYSFKSRTIINKEKLIFNIAWLGRLSDDKISSLINILKHADCYVNENNLQINFHIIGDGNRKNSLEEFNFNKKLNIIRLDNIKGNQLRRYLVDHVDLLFAMGTSALEGASLSIPTILADFSYESIPTLNKFKWLYESKNYSLGDEYSENLSNDNTFAEIIKKICLDKNNYYSERCYNYFKENHALDIIVNQLEELLSKAELQISELNKSAFRCFYKIGFIRRTRNYIKYL